MKGLIDYVENKEKIEEMIQAHGRLQDAIKIIVETPYIDYGQCRKIVNEIVKEKDKLAKGVRILRIQDSIEVCEEVLSNNNISYQIHVETKKRLDSLNRQLNRLL